MFSFICFMLFITFFICRAAGALPQTAEDTIGRNPCVRSSIHPSNNHYAVQCKIRIWFTHTIFFKFKIWHAIGSFENRKMPVRACSTYGWGRSGADWVDTTSKVDSQNEKSKLGLVIPRVSTAIIFGLRRPHALRGWF